jgi:hypothetical protein
MDGVGVHSGTVHEGMEERERDESYTPTKLKKYCKAGCIGLQTNGNLTPIKAT